jgi:hypothetical protein
MKPTLEHMETITARWATVRDELRTADHRAKTADTSRARTEALCSFADMGGTAALVRAEVKTQQCLDWLAEHLGQK